MSYRGLKSSCSVSFGRSRHSALDPQQFDSARDIFIPPTRSSSFTDLKHHCAGDGKQPLALRGGHTGLQLEMKNSSLTARRLAQDGTAFSAMIQWRATPNFPKATPQNAKRFHFFRQEVAPILGSACMGCMRPLNFPAGQIRGRRDTMPDRARSRSGRNF
jgi:hypothetical protein